MAYTSLFADMDDAIVEKNKRIRKSRGGKHVATRRRKGRGSDGGGGGESSADAEKGPMNTGHDSSEEDDGFAKSARAARHNRDVMYGPEDETSDEDRRHLSPLDVDTIAQLKQAFDVVDTDRDSKLNHAQTCRVEKWKKNAEKKIRVSKRQHAYAYIYASGAPIPLPSNAPLPLFRQSACTTADSHWSGPDDNPRGFPHLPRREG